MLSLLEESEEVGAEGKGNGRHKAFSKVLIETVRIGLNYCKYTSFGSSSKMKNVNTFS